MCGRGMGDSIDWKIRIGWRIQTSRELVPSAIIGYIHIYKEWRERSVIRGLVERNTIHGLEGSDWLEDSDVQGPSPFSHHRICTYIRVNLEGAGAAGSTCSLPLTLLYPICFRVV